MAIYALHPHYINQKSFYGKAHVIIDPTTNDAYLQSYSTIVAKISHGRFYHLWDYYSDTTMKHINEFRLENNFNAISKREWFALPVERLR